MKAKSRIRQASPRSTSEGVDVQEKFEGENDSHPKRMMKSSGVNLATVLNLTRNMPFLTPLMFKYAKLANMVKKSSTRIACILKTGKKYAKVSANAFATAALAMIAAPKMKMFVVRKPAYLPKATST